LKLGLLTREGVWRDDDIQFNALFGKFTTRELKEETNANKKWFATVVFRSGYLRHHRCTSLFGVLYLNSSKAQQIVAFYVIYFILLARSGQQNVYRTSSLMYLGVRWNLGLWNTIPLFSVAEVYDPGCLLVRNVVLAVFSRSLSLISGLCHRNPNQPPWGTWWAGAEQESRYILMGAGHVRMRYDIASNVKKCSYTPFPLWFSLRQLALSFILS